jgi:hypothetical protein
LQVFRCVRGSRRQIWTIGRLNVVQNMAIRPCLLYVCFMSIALVGFKGHRMVPFSL